MDGIGCRGIGAIPEVPKIGVVSASGSLIGEDSKVDICAKVEVSTGRRATDGHRLTDGIGATCIHRRKADLIGAGCCVGMNRIGLDRVGSAISKHPGPTCRVATGEIREVNHQLVDGRPEV